MAVVTFQPEFTPALTTSASVVFIGDETPALWLMDGGTAAWHVTTPELLPERGVDVVVLRVKGPPELEASDLIRRVKARCEPSLWVCVVDQDTITDELKLLALGVSLVLAADVDPRLASARLLAVVRAGLNRSQLRRVESEPDGDDGAHGRRLLALSFTSRLLHSVTDEAEIFQRLIEVISRELHSARVSLMRVDHDAGELRIQCAVGLDASVISSARPRIGEGIAGTCALLGEPLFIDDHDRLREGRSDLSEFTSQSLDVRQLPMSLTVPLKVKGEVVGVVNVTERDDQGTYSRQDIAFVSDLMGQIGVLLENARLLGHMSRLRAFSERVINTLCDPLAVLDAELMVVSANERFVALFGGGPGEHLFDRLPLETAAKEAIEAYRLSLTPLPVLIVGDRAFEPSLSPFEGESERPFLLLFLRDVTLRRQMERRLLAAEKMVSLGVLAAGVAHEINNPLAFVKANSRHAHEYLRDLLAIIEAWNAAAEQIGKNAAFLAARRLEAEADLNFLRTDCAKMMKESIDGIGRIERIVQSLKSFAHPDTEQTRPGKIADLVENALMLTQGKWRYKLEVKRDFQDVPSVECLPSQLEQVFINLIVNAAQASGEWAHLEIRISNEVRADQDGVRIDFEDDCGGIPESIVDRVFEPFFTTKDIGEGTGLGLSICYTIIENHAGKLSVSSEAGKGSTFTVFLPIGAGRPIVTKQASRFRI